MNRKLFLSFCSAVATATAAFSPLPDATPEKFLGGPENLQLVTGATAVTVFRIVHPEQKPKPGDLVTLDGNYKCEGSPVAIEGPEVQHLIAALSDVTNFGEELMCVFDPGVIVRFEAGEHHLDLVICFGCHEMVLYRDGAIVRRPFKWAKVKNTFSGDANRAFLAIARKAFPKDAESQPPKK